MNTSTAIIKALVLLAPLLMFQTQWSFANNAPWTTVESASSKVKAPRVLIVHDMEGLSGQSEVETIFYQFSEYARGQQLLAADINAAVDGFLKGGAALVHVADGHGSGNPGPDLLPKLLDPRAKQLFRMSPFDPYLGLVAENNYDAIAVVGAHAGTGTGGFAAHTLTLGMDLIINETPITETDFLGLSWGRNKIPVIFASGDDVYAEQVGKTMPWLEVAVTKYAIDAGNARLRPLDEAHEEIRAKAQRAIEKIASAKAMRVREPMTVTLRTVPPADLSALKNMPGIDYSEPGLAPQDAAVTIDAENWDAAMSGMWSMIGVARGGYMKHTIEQYEREGEHRKFDEFYERRMRVWIDQESGRLQETPVENHGRPLPEQFHGVR